MTSTLKLLKLAGLFILTFAFTIKMMQWMGIGCASSLCRLNGYPYGMQLVLALLLLSLIGGIYTHLTVPKNGQSNGFQLFTSIAIGLALLVAYVYARSLFNHLVHPLPITRWELLGLGLLGLGTAWAKTSTSRSNNDNNGATVATDHTILLLSVAILIALCFLFADRELPRLMSLSSDPDQHAFFGKQIARYGSIPYAQGAWGPQTFNYPAGSGVLLFVMSLLGGLNPTDTLVTLPVLLTFLAAMMLVEQLSLDLKSTLQKAVLQLSAVAFVAGGLMFPLFMEYVHGEGSARVMSMLFSALFLVVLAPELKCPAHPSARVVGMASLVLFVLMALSPANAMMPAVLLASTAVYGLLNGKLKWGLLLVLVGGVVLALLDPYYQRLAGLSNDVSAETLVMAGHFELLQIPEIWARTLQFYLENGDQFLRNMAVLLAENGISLFAILILTYGAAWLAIPPRPRLTLKQLVSALAFVGILFLVYGFTFAFLNDRRFHLLGPYFFFNISQYKALLLIAVLTQVIKKPMVLKSGLGIAMAIPLAVALIWPAQLMIRNNQKMFLDPRRSYCGSLGCLPEDDVKLLKAFEQLTQSGALARSDGKTSRVLLPNFFTNSEIESWIFPIASARVLPQFEVLPAAFYYFQGEPDYGTASYDARVCQQLDRPWLKSMRIDYLFLPTDREAACLSGMEGLVQTEKVVLKEGNAYLLQFQP